MARRHPPEGAARLPWRRATRTALCIAALTLGVSAGGGATELAARSVPVLEQVLPSPDGAWIAVQTAGDRVREHHLWLVSVGDGTQRQLPDHAPSGAPLRWREGTLRVEVADPRLGRREMRWIDPEDHTVVRTGRSTPLLQAEEELEGGMGWAQVSQLRTGPGRRVSSLRWLERDEEFSLSDIDDISWQITREPGLVFFASRDRDGYRVHRRDLARQWTSEIASIEGTEPAWEVSPDGRSLWVTDGERTHIVSAVDGHLVAGPWRSGRVRWLQAADSRFCLLAVGGHHYLVDVLLDRQLHLGAQTAAETEVFVLGDGGFVLRRGNRIDLLDQDARPTSNLLPGRLETAPG